VRSIFSEILQRFLKMQSKDEKAIAQKEAVVSLTFDDAYQSVYLNAYPSMKEHDFMGVIFPIIGLIGHYFEGHKIMKERTLHELYSNGWEIGSHTFSHPYSLGSSNYTREQYRAEITLSKSKLENLGFSVISFAYPYGFCSAAPLIEEVRRSYKYARTLNQGINEMCRSNLFLKCVVFKNDRFNDVKPWIDKVKTEGGWLIISCHGIALDQVPLPAPIYLWSHKATFDRLLNYIEEKEVGVATFQDVNKSSK